MTRRTRVLGLSTIFVLAYTSSAFAQAAAPAPGKSPSEVAPDAPPTTPTPAAAQATEPAATPAPADAPPAAPVTTPAEVAPAAPPVTPGTFVPLKIENPSATLKLGVLAQPQFEAIGNADPSVGGRSYNLFVRRIRLLAGGTLFGKFEYFVDIDSPNLGKLNGETKSGPLFVQDAYVTWKAAEDLFKIDAGYMLPPLAHNAVQGAGTLYGLDYFGNTFRHNGVFGSPNDIGRDAGVEARGLVLDNHIEYRVGVFQGFRRPATAQPDPNPMNLPRGEAGARNTPRVAGRLQINLLDAETGFFYAGTYLGKKKILSVGASFDAQNDYRHWSIDGFLDMPVGPGVLTAQANVVKWNGHDFITALPNQIAYMAEAGYLIDAVQLSPIVRFEYRNTKTQTKANPDEARYGLGLAYWPYGHNINLKTMFTRIQPKADPVKLDGYNQFQLQWQLYFY